MLANIVSFNGFDYALGLALITSAVFIAGSVFEDTMHFKNFFKWSLLKLNCAQNLFVFIAFKKRTSNAWLISDMAFILCSIVKRGFLIDGNIREGQKWKRKRTKEEKKDKGEEKRF